MILIAGILESALIGAVIGGTIGAILYGVKALFGNNKKNED
ncbi:hypothetical protein N9Y42_02590 [Mariniblastus sp.]|nr:hypothetical protein [Mariniblastus sp.]